MTDAIRHPKPKLAPDLPDWARSWVELRVMDPMYGQYCDAGIYVSPLIGSLANKARSELRLRSDIGDAAVRQAALLPNLGLKSLPSKADSPADIVLDASATKIAPVAPAELKLPSSAPPLKGQRVRVIRPDVLDRYVQDSSALTTRWSRAEGKAFKDMAEAVRRRGTKRVVVLEPGWRAGLDALHAEMPNFSTAIDHVRGACELSEFARAPLRITPMLLVGGPGLGKTRFATRLAAVLGVPQFVYALESAETASVLAGSEKHWSNSEPGQLFRLIMLGEVANPVIVLDELDKAPGSGLNSSGAHYRPAQALCGLLEPETARAARDKSADLVFDASYVTYVATANRLSPIDGTLLSRFTLFHISTPDARGAVEIARSVAKRVLKELQLDKVFAPISGGVLQQLALLGSPRLQRRVLRGAIGRAVTDGRRCVDVKDLGSDVGNDVAVDAPVLQ